MRINRSDRSLVADWWFTIDRLMLTAVLLLIASGVVLSLAASPPVATKLGLEPFHFFKRHLIFVLPAIVIMLSVSLLEPRHTRRLCLLLYIAGIALMGSHC